jgi:hypothetical protein
VKFIQGDTDAVAYGMGIGGSRSTTTRRRFTPGMMRATDGRGRYWGSGYSHSFRHGVFRHVHQRQRFEPDLDFWQWGGGWWAGYHYCGGWAYQYGYAPHSCYIFGGG